MTTPTYEDFYPGKRSSGLTEAEEAEYAELLGLPAPEGPEKPDALTALNQALEAIASGNNYPKEK